VRIIGPHLSTQGIGAIAFGQPRLQFAINADYRISRWPAVSFDLSLTHFGAAPASVDNAVYTTKVTELSAVSLESGQ
jgi:hypothetical protein